MDERILSLDKRIGWTGIGSLDSWSVNLLCWPLDHATPRVNINFQLKKSYFIFVNILRWGLTVSNFWLSFKQKIWNGKLCHKIYFQLKLIHWVLKWNSVTLYFIKKSQVNGVYFYQQTGYGFSSFLMLLASFSGLYCSITHLHDYQMKSFEK